MSIKAVSVVLSTLSTRKRRFIHTSACTKDMKRVDKTTLTTEEMFFTICFGMVCKA